MTEKLFGTEWEYSPGGHPVALGPVTPGSATLSPPGSPILPKSGGCVPPAHDIGCSSYDVILTTLGTYQFTAPGMASPATIIVGPPPPPPPILRASTGTITFLRVNDMGIPYGTPPYAIDVDVVVQLAGYPGYAFGFQLRDDQYLPQRRGMLDLLRDAYLNGRAVTLEYLIIPGSPNGLVQRAWMP